MRIVRFAVLPVLSLVLLTWVMPVRLAAQGDVAKGKTLYDTSPNKCATCHKIGGKGGKLAPDLSNVGNRHDEAWLSKYLPNPKSINPKNVMPPVKLGDADMKALIAYLLSLKSGS
ncbi:MAG TPA: cytochrome c [Vicinamibacterales bacterium]|nr:cytochrome c [Vicinamibacterales bacterium]